MQCEQTHMVLPGKQETVLLKSSRHDTLRLQAPNQEAMCFQNRYSEWEERHRCKVITSTRGTFMDMFDDDDTLMYEPAQTAAIILTGDDEEAEKAALEVIRQCLHRKDVSRD